MPLNERRPSHLQWALPDVSTTEQSASECTVGLGAPAEIDASNSLLLVSFSSNDAFTVPTHGPARCHEILAHHVTTAQSLFPFGCSKPLSPRSLVSRPRRPSTAPSSSTPAASPALTDASLSPSSACPLVTPVNSPPHTAHGYGFPRTAAGPSAVPRMQRCGTPDGTRRSEPDFSAVDRRERFSPLSQYRSLGSAEPHDLDYITDAELARLAKSGKIDSTLLSSLADMSLRLERHGSNETDAAAYRRLRRSIVARAIK